MRKRLKKKLKKQIEWKRMIDEVKRRSFTVTGRVQLEPNMSYIYQSISGRFSSDCPNFEEIPKGSKRIEDEGKYFLVEMDCGEIISSEEIK